MLTPAEAERLVLENTPPMPREDCPLARAHGRFLRDAIVADRDLPPYDRVMLDGYALRSSSVAAGTETFRVEAVQAAGVRPLSLSPARDACVEVMTGAVLPAGADCVVPYEDTTRSGAAVLIGAGARFPEGHAIHRKGSDHHAGQVVIPEGVRITGREIAVAASCGRAVLPVSQSPKIAVIATGDELVEVDAVVAPHQVRRSNDYAIRAALAAAGFPRVERFHLHDMRHEIEHMLWHIIAEFDVVILTGGVSKGKFDFLPEELDRLGVHKLFQGVAQRPGKPFWFGLSARNTPVFALPGNPVSAYTCLHRYIIPALEKSGGVAPSAPRPVALAEPFTFKSALACLLPVRLLSGPGAQLLAAPAPGNTSGDFAGLVGTDGFVELPPGPASFPAGTIVPFWKWA
jgi:molybdopterin molybdotransferase